MDNMASREKKASVIIPIPIHIHPTRMDRKIKRTSAAGRKS